MKMCICFEPRSLTQRGQNLVRLERGVGVGQGNLHKCVFIYVLGLIHWGNTRVRV